MARMLFLRDIDADVQLRCRACGHGGVLPRAMLERRFGPNYPVLSIAPHYRCSRCDSRDIESRPILDVPQAASPAASDDEPSFDAPLAALNGLLASLRGDGAPGGMSGREPAAASPPPSLPTPPPAPVRAKPLSDLPLSDLVADGPGDEGVAPLWEPVSLADMAARLGRTSPQDDWDDEPPASDARTPANDARPESTGEDSRGDGDSEDGTSEDGDETLMAMRQLLAQAYGSDDDQDDGREDEREDGRDGGWNGGPPASHARHTTRFAERPSVDDPAGEEPGQNDHGQNDPPAFSHKVLVRRDFEDDWADADDDSWEAEAGGQEDDLDAGESDGEEPSEEEILSFAIRDPEKKSASVSRPAKPIPTPASAPLDFDQHRAERRAQRPPPPPEDEEGFDRTLAALRSMIEDAATEPEEEDAPPRKRSANKSALRADQDPTDGWDDPEPMPEPAVSRAAEPDPEPAPAGRRSAQEREIEEAMKALRGLIEDEVKPDLPAAPPSSPQPKPRAGQQRPARGGSVGADSGRPQNGPLASVPPPDVQSPETPSNGDQTGKPAGEPTPLSKTIAALRGMLELDGRRKR